MLIGLFLLAIIFTSLSYFLGDRTLFQQIHWVHPLIIGTSVGSAGALAEKLHAPMWLIIVLPFLIGMGLLLSFLDWNVFEFLCTYILTLFYYTILHIILSKFTNFHSLIPAWKLN
ncbi:hypothetical protein F7731_18705 [Cytobacillus depressus]|uniref:Uncharacterized protein n=1 Tax=Cytobacillus depressus TaxID=1602942 RepID=A0A6L3V2U5_9BACI|nr:hypothetical protein [Cytobacillus depressus]KAB2331113.1 hypothetical protein F7731_18705 [Cytobacillus depressus]